MEEDETVETMFSRFQILVSGLKVLDKGYSTADHVKKIIRSLPKKWRPMVTTLKPAKDLNAISLEELIISLRIHGIELEEDDPQKKGKSLALNSKNKFKTNAFQEEEESSGGSSSEEDELSLISKRVQQLWKHKQRKPRNYRRSDDYSESSFGHRKSRNREVICYECNEPGHYKSDCPKLQKEKPKKNFNKEKKKSMMATWDDSESSEVESEDECANIALMENTLSDTSSSESESDSEVEEMCLTAKLKHQSWYLDSGCSRHMMGKKHMFQSLDLKAADLSAEKARRNSTSTLNFPSE
ncbi:uncharacterized protein LOC131629265 [Vicia villosa]|uniref:uncharacterized protein LOC131629265 n=1 Tax=Vicia villosa TaxID=3911 RepID=UPI00273BD9F2|nr:uncharacterized protein LOC131629265 [Vicia villosa]